MTTSISMQSEDVTVIPIFLLAYALTCKKRWSASHGHEEALL